MEVGVGLVPGWGGCKEMLIRGQHGFGRGPMPAIAHAFETISTAKVGRSAAECRDLGYLRKSDEIVMNRERLLASAKVKALALVKDYKPPAATEFHLPGPSGKAALMLAVGDFVRQGKATAYDRVVAEGLADVLTGGPAADQTIVTTEDKVSELERKTITRLLRHPETLARMEYTLANGKPLRN